MYKLILAISFLMFITSCKTTQGSLKELRAIELAAAKDWQGKMGFFLGEAKIPGARIVQVADFGFADVLMLKEDDVIVAVNGVGISSHADFQVKLSKISKRNLSQWFFTVVRGGSKLTISNPKGFRCSSMDLVGCGPVPNYRKR